MVSKETKIVNPMGMHMRPAGMFAQAMMKYDSDVTLVFGDKEVNAKSIMNLMAACIKCGSELEVRCSGPDEEAALAEAIRLIESGLGE
ncbi:PTS sugar transporter subunit IIA [Oscillospiraceae bacterium]|uniref:HPr family phosphocarrier protein n=1 Tax=Allofournierella sp. TaxID=1940256 RepID=UPI0015B05619|nr:PTS sugar transporter subunit IIA [Oscillospiraceae bacterium]